MRTSQDFKHDIKKHTRELRELAKKLSDLTIKESTADANTQVKTIETQTPFQIEDKLVVTNT